MSMFRKKPIVVDAFQMTSERLSNPGLGWPAWLVESLTRPEGATGRTLVAQSSTSVRKALYIYTLEGVMEANENDWVIRGVKGEVYPCKPEIFEATYERLED